MSNSDKSSSIRRRALVPKAECPMALAAELLGDRWTMLILREAFYGVVRYDDMLADLEAPRSMLTDRLSKMVAKGLLERRSYQEPGSRARNAYVLTDAGRALGKTLIALTEWGETHVLGKPAPVQVIDTESGKPLKLELVAPNGKVVALDKVALKLRKDKNS